MEAASTIANTLVLNGSEKSRYIQDRDNQDIVLGMLLLKTILPELRWADFVPDLLEKLGLIYSWMATLYALGHEEYLRQEKVISADQSNKTTMEFFGQWLTQPASNDLPEYPEFLSGNEITLSTYVIGCHITIETANEFESLCLGETIIAVLEAFFATGLDRSIIPFQPELHIIIKPSEYVTGMPQYRIDETAEVVKIEILHVPMLPRGVLDQRDAFGKWLNEILRVVLCQIAVIPDPKTTIDKMEIEGAAFSRALSITDTDVCITNILGKNPKFSLWGWRNQTDKVFPLLRSKPWYEGVTFSDDKVGPAVHLSEIKHGEMKWLSGIDNLKHRDIQVYSIINIPLWDKAGWSAMAYNYSPDEPPYLVFGFSNPEAGRAIFKAWHSRFGNNDEKEYIRISIITGIDKNKPYSYSTVISINPEVVKKDGFGFMVCRANRMNPDTPHNLNGFLSRFYEMKSYVVMPAFYIKPSLPAEASPDLGIGIKALRVCEAWQIDEHDPDIFGLSPDMDPIIPEGVNDPPIYRAFKSIQKIRESRED
jgi:hypothetical protein